MLDPFAGSGTTLQVSTWLGRDAVGIELNPEYVALAEERIATMPRCLMPKTKRRLIVEAVDDGLFAGM